MTKSAYRAPGDVDASLPLPREHLGAWTLGIRLGSAIAALVPFALGAFDGTGSVLVLAVHVICAIAIAVLGVAVARGTRGAVVLVPFAMAPFVVSFGAVAARESWVFSSVGAPTTADHVRRLAEIFATIDGVAILGSFGSGALAIVAALAALAAVVDIDVRRMRAPSNAWIGVAAFGLAVTAAVSILGVRITYEGGRAHHFGLVAVILGALFAGPAFARMRGIDAAQKPGEIDRVARAVSVGALLLASAAMLLDRGAFVIDERTILARLSVPEVGAPERGILVGALAQELRTLHVMAVVDALAAAITIVPTMIGAMRGSQWRPIAITIALVAVVYGGASTTIRIREEALVGFGSVIGNVQARLPDRLAIVPTTVSRPPAPRTYDRVGEVHDFDTVNVAIFASGEARDLRADRGHDARRSAMGNPPPGARGPLIVAMDLRAPFARVYDPVAHAALSNTHDGDEERITVLVGRTEHYARPSLGPYAWLGGIELGGYPVEIVRAVPANEGALYVLATSRTEAKVAVRSANATSPPVTIGFDDLERAKTALLAVVGHGVLPAVVSPMPDATAEDVYAMLYSVVRALRGEDWAPIFVTDDRAGVSRWMGP